jgi:hypothetical protein
MKLIVLPAVLTFLMAADFAAGIYFFSFRMELELIAMI